MKFRVEKDSLREAIKWIVKTVADRSHRPELSGMKFAVENSLLTISSYDGHIYSETTLQVDSTGEGSFLVMGTLIDKMMSSLPKDVVEVESIGDEITITCKSTSYKVKTMAIDDFPTMPSTDADIQTFELGYKQLSNLISQTMRAVSNKPHRISLTGVNFDVSDDSLTAVSTDTYRISLQTVSLQNGVNTSAILSPETLLQAKNAADSTQSVVKIGVSPSHVSFDFPDRRFVSTILEGPYPDYKRLVTIKTDKQFTVNREELINVIERTVIIASEEKAITPIKLNINTDRLDISVTSDETGVAKETIDINYDNTEIDISFNPTYLLAGLKSFNTELIDFHFTESVAPAIINPVLPDDSDIKEALYIIMPTRK